MIHPPHPTTTALVSFVIGGVFGASVTAILSPRRGRRSAGPGPRTERASGSRRVPEPGLPTTTSAYVSHS